MALATLEDLAALGAVPLNLNPADEESKRAERLLELASGQALAYLRVDDEATFVASLTAAETTSLAAIVAEAAAARLNVSAAPSTDPYAEPMGGLVSALLNRRHYRAIDRALGRAGRGSRSVETERDEGSSFLSYIPNRRIPLELDT